MLLHRNAQAEIWKIQRIVNIIILVSSLILRTVIVVSWNQPGGKKTAVVQVVQSRVRIAGIHPENVAGAGVSHPQAIDIFAIIADGISVERKDRISCKKRKAGQ